MSNVDWRTEMKRVALLYFAHEKKQMLPTYKDGTAFDFVRQEIDDLHRDGYIEINEAGDGYVVTDKGIETLKKVVAMFDQIYHFEIFGLVDVTTALTDEEAKPNNPNEIRDHLYDASRFGFIPPDATDLEAEEISAQYQDLRLAMMDYFSRIVNTRLSNPIDPRRIIFVQQLANGGWDPENFWFDLQLGEIFKQIDEIVKSAYKIEDFDPDPTTAMEIAKSYYQAGMIETKKRNGRECANPECNAALALFDEKAGKPVTRCPMCKADLNPPDEPEQIELSCPKCGDTSIKETMRHCPGCGAALDFSGQPGSINYNNNDYVEEDDGYVEDTPFGYDYGYVPYGYYSPYDPFMDALAFAVICDVIW